jgi:hypothetical protein
MVLEVASSFGSELLRVLKARISKDKREGILSDLLFVYTSLGHLDLVNNPIIILIYSHVLVTDLENALA